MEQVARDTYRLGSRSHNFYMMVRDREVTVIDSGCSREWGTLVEGLDAVDLDVESVSAILTTHGHADHLGFSARADREGLPVSIHEDDESRAVGTYRGRFSAGASHLPMYKFSTWRNLLPLLRSGVLKVKHLERVATFMDGDVLDVPGSPQAIHIPGHTEGHTMFLSAEGGLLFTGDGLITMDLTGNSSGPQIIGSMFNLDPQLAYRSLDRITNVDAELILPGHGNPWEGSPADAVKIARADHR